MDNNITYNLSVERLRKYFPMNQWVGIGNDFCMFRVTYEDHLRALEYPCRFDGLMIVYCISGSVKFSINLNEYDITANHLIITNPGNIFKVTDVPEGETQDLNYVVVAMSQKFASELKVDFKKLLNEGVALMETPVVSLSEQDQKIFGSYLSLMAEVVQVESRFKDAALSSVVSSMLCLVAGLWVNKLDELKREASMSTTRSKMVFEQFVKLVVEHHTQHRNVGFYADKLCLTPKYLSKLIKTVSGRSAPEWIDAYVVLEAKNLLKYSEMAIKEIVYNLNFPNQSVFYKFFKARTGMTPSEYRNS